MAEPAAIGLPREMLLVRVTKGEPGLLIKIDKHITLLDFPGFQYPHCNCLWIEDDINCLIDSSPGEADLAYLKTQAVDLIINSHGHVDHYLYNDHFPNSKILMHQADHAMAQSADGYLEEFGVKLFTDDPNMYQLFLQGNLFQTTRVDGEIKDHQVIRLGATTLETLHLPGHSPGHCGFLFPEQGFIFTADIDLSRFGPWYGTMNCSLADFINSIERLLSMKPDYLITGHGKAIIKEDVSRRLREYRDIIYARQRRIVDLIDHGRHSLDEIAGAYPVYRQLPRSSSMFYHFERMMILVHLRYLQDLGHVIEENRRYYLKEGIRPSDAY